MTAAESGAFWSLWAPILVAVGLAVVDWVAVWAGGRAGLAGLAGLAVERIAKPGVMVALLAAALLGHAWSLEAQVVRPWLVLALVASLAGDVLLLPPGRFVPGLVAFLVAHLAYLVAFLHLPGQVPWLVTGVVAGVVLVATVGRVLVRAAGGAGLRGPVALYLVVICAMAVVATRTGDPFAILGAWLFVASDAMLGWGRLRAPRPDPQRGGRGLGVTVMVTYHLAQVLLVLALAW